MRIPGYLLTHTIQIEPFLGNYSHGPKYGPGVSYPCFVEDRTTLQLDREGREVVSSSTVYIGDLSAVIPVQSRGTVNGRDSIVLDVKRREGKGLPTPDHLEVILR